MVAIGRQDLTTIDGRHTKMAWTGPLARATMARIHFQFSSRLGNLGRRALGDFFFLIGLAEWNQDRQTGVLASQQVGK